MPAEFVSQSKADSQIDEGEGAGGGAGTAQGTAELSKSEVESDASEPVLRNRYEEVSSGLLGWCYLITVLDWYIRVMVGWNL